MWVRIPFPMPSWSSASMRTLICHLYPKRGNLPRTQVSRALWQVRVDRNCCFLILCTPWRQPWLASSLFKQALVLLMPPEVTVYPHLQTFITRTLWIHLFPCNSLFNFRVKLYYLLGQQQICGEKENLLSALQKQPASIELLYMPNNVNLFMNYIF